jgi:hypothetical protein
MNGNFSRLNLQGGGAKVQVHGWLDRRDGGDSAELSVTVTRAPSPRSATRPWT